jgi:hypothetical protein
MWADGFGNLVYVFSLLCSSLQGSPDLPYRLGQFTGLLSQPQRRNTLPFMLPTKVWVVLQYVVCVTGPTQDVPLPTVVH